MPVNGVSENPVVPTTIPPASIPGIGAQLGGLNVTAIMGDIEKLTSSLVQLQATIDTAGVGLTAIQAFLTTTTIPIKLDDQSATILNTFSRNFGGYVEKLASINIPDTINLVGRHTVTVNINGAQAFEAMEENISRLVVTEVNKQLRKQTDGQLGSNYDMDR